MVEWGEGRGRMLEPAKTRLFFGLCTRQKFFSLRPNGDLSHLGNGERSSAQPKAREGRAERERASHWVRVRGFCFTVEISATSPRPTPPLCGGVGEFEQVICHFCQRLNPKEFCSAITRRSSFLATPG